jgi:hypothetical protein
VDPVFVAVNVGVVPETRLLLMSFKVIVTVETATPSAITGPVPVIVELAAMAEPELNKTVPSALVIGDEIERVLSSDFVDFNVHVEIPEASVALQAE